MKLKGEHDLIWDRRKLWLKRFGLLALGFGIGLTLSAYQGSTWALAGFWL